jgi:hypothetical protein
MMTIIMLLTLPPLVYYIWFCLELNHGQLMLPSARMLDHFPLPPFTSVAIVAGWLIFQGLLQIYAPGKWVNDSSRSGETPAPTLMISLWGSMRPSAATATGCFAPFAPGCSRLLAK